MYSLFKDLNVVNNIFIYIVAVICLLVVYNVVRKFYEYRDIKQYLPVVYGLPFFGILHNFVPLERLLSGIGSYFYQLKYWSYLTWFGNVPLIVTVDPDIIKRILNSDEFLNKASVIYATMDKALPNGLITSRFFKWKHNRKLMNSSFAPQIIQQFIPDFNECCKKISQYFESLTDGKEHAIFGCLKQETLHMAVGTTMGPVLADGEKLKDNMAGTFNRLLGRLFTSITLSFLNLSFLTRTPSYYKMITDLKTYLKNLIQRKLDFNSEQEGVYFLDRAIKYQQQNLFGQDDTITETYTMIIGSFETISTTLYSFITMLAMHQDVQEKLYQEIIQNVGSEKDIEPKDLDQLPYLNMVIDETLRLMPPINIMGRECLENCYLTKNIKLPRDFQILISIFHLHRRQDLWGPNADKFNPDNFLPENVAARHPYAYIPYSKGVRNCVGWRYAQIAMKVLAINLVREFQFATEFPYNKLIFINQLSIRFLNEPKIRVVKRKWCN